MHLTCGYIEIRGILKKSGYNDFIKQLYGILYPQYLVLNIHLKKNI